MTRIENVYYSYRVGIMMRANSSMLLSLGLVSESFITLALTPEQQLFRVRVGFLEHGRPLSRRLW